MGDHDLNVDPRFSDVVFILRITIMTDIRTRDTQLECDKKFMQIAIDESRKGVYPYGAILVKDNVVEFMAHNSASSDPTAHAEVEVIRIATQALKKSSLAGYTLYTSSESCPMCAAAEVWAKVDRVVFGASIQQLVQRAGQEQIELPSHIVNSLWNGSKVKDGNTYGAFKLTGEVLVEESLQVFEEWKKKKQNEKT